jgi:AbrB family looped-hinge helix DNA binding protein
MFREPKFFGSTTVGDRGQIVLPAELRKEYNIEAGDKLLVVGMPGGDRAAHEHILLLKAEVLNRVLAFMEVQKNAIKKILDEEENSKSK